MLIPYKIMFVASVYLVIYGVICTSIMINGVLEIQ